MSRSPELTRLLASPPAAHVDSAGRPLPWGIAPEALELIDEVARPGARTLETGCGLTTALLALKGAVHDCVVPFTEESDRLRAWADREGASLDGVTFHHGYSDRVLPALGDDPLDLVVIDGGHGFPMPFLDWWYAGRRLREGGVLVVDDTHLWTGRVLEGFLRADDHWEVVQRLPLRSAAFRRTSTAWREEEWNTQPYVRRRSFSGGPRGAVRRAVRAAGRLRRA